MFDLGNWRKYAGGLRGLLTPKRKRPDDSASEVARMSVDDQPPTSRQKSVPTESQVRFVSGPPSPPLPVKGGGSGIANQGATDIASSDAALRLLS